MKIILVGPFPPLRGGISMFNHSLAEELSMNNEVHRVSFSLQYPKLFFPGKTQTSDFKGKESKAIINSINPLSWLNTAKLILKISPDVVIFQYWHPFFAPAFSYIAKRIKKKSNARIIVNCNNIVSHEPKRLDWLLTNFFLNNCDEFMVMSDKVKKDLLSIIPKANYRLSPHPVYNIFGKSILKKDAKKILKLEDEKIILNFGLIRNYKGLEILIKASKYLKNELNNFKIIVAGECYLNEEKYLKMARNLNVDTLFDFRFKFIPNSEVKNYFSAADLIVLPYISATQSGIIPIAYNFNKPVIVSNVGGLPENVINGKTGYICEPKPRSIADGVIKFYNNTNTSFERNISNYKKNYSWDTFSNILLNKT